MAASRHEDEEAASWSDLYSVNLVPSEVFLKFREEVEGFRVGLNYEFYNFQASENHMKLVLKSLTPERRWKLIYEPKYGDVRIFTKKIPMTQYLSLQIGIGHNFRHHTTGWKWKLSTCLGGDGISQIRNRTSVHVFPAMAIRFGWRAEYILPEVHGAIGTEEPIIGMNFGRLYASLDRVETILTHKA